MNFEIKVLITEEELRALFLVFQEAFPHFSWSQEDFLATVKNPRMLFIGAFFQEKLVGGIQFSFLFEEAELLNLAVARKMQKKGLGSQLLKAGEIELLKQGIEKIFLEVRKSNFSAQKLYEKQGFYLLNQRKNYYQSPTEDALIYCRDVF